jgi:hypothetical protein
VDIHLDIYVLKQIKASNSQFVVLFLSLFLRLLLLATFRSLFSMNDFASAFKIIMLVILNGNHGMYQIVLIANHGFTNSDYNYNSNDNSQDQRKYILQLKYKKIYIQ